MKSVMMGTLLAMMVALSDALELSGIIVQMYQTRNLFVFMHSRAFVVMGFGTLLVNNVMMVTQILGMAATLNAE